MQKLLGLAPMLVVLCSVFTYVASAQELQPGDYQYQHQKYHPYYKKLYAEGKCSCKTGYCRPTVYRYWSASPTGVQVKVSGKWYDVPPAALLHKNTVPPELWRADAHVCAHPDRLGHEVIECAVINAGT